MSNYSRIENLINRNRTNSYLKLLGFFLILVILFHALVVVNVPTINVRGWIIARNIISGLFNPNYGIIFSLNPYDVPFLLLQTIAIAFIGTVISSAISFFLAIISYKDIGHKYLSLVVQPLIVIIRVTPMLVFASVFVLVVGFGPMAGVLAISVNNIGIMTKLFIEIFDDIDLKPITALEAIGISRFRILLLGYLPIVFSQLVSIIIFRFDINIRSSSTLGIVGAGGVGGLLSLSINLFDWRSVGSVIWSTILLILIF